MSSVMNNERNPQVSVIPVGTMATSAAATVPGLYFRKASRIKNVYFVDKTGIVLNSSNHLAVDLQDNAGSPVNYAHLDTSDAAAVALTQLALTPSASLLSRGELPVPAGTMLNVKITGTGTAVPTLATVLIEWYPL